MLKIVYVEVEVDEDGKKVVHYDPRPGLSDYTLYTLHTRGTMWEWEMDNAGQIVKDLLQAADYENEIFEKIAKQPVDCYAINRTCIKLILFSHFEAIDIKCALESGYAKLTS